MISVAANLPDDLAALATMLGGTLVLCLGLWWFAESMSPRVTMRCARRVLGFTNDLGWRTANGSWRGRRVTISCSKTTTLATPLAGPPVHWQLRRVGAHHEMAPEYSELPAPEHAPADNFVATGAPLDVVRLVLDDLLRARLNAATPLMLVTKPDGVLTMELDHFPSGTDEAALTNALALLVDFAARLEDTVAEADAALVASVPQSGAAFRGSPDGEHIRRVRAAHAAEIEAARRRGNGSKRSPSS